MKLLDVFIYLDSCFGVSSPELFIFFGLFQSPELFCLLLEI